MKILATFFSVLFLNVIVFAQASQKMSYQAVVRNNNNSLVTGTPVGMRISILQGSASGQAIYVEKHTPTTNANGLASIEIGGGTVISGSFLTINWANGPYFVKTETDPSGGTAYSITGTSQLLSVPYALYAKTAESVLGGGPLTHYVGEYFGGGVVFDVFRDANGFEHGLIVGLSDLGNAYWGPNTNVPNSSDEFDGETNTASIIAAGGLPADAAGLCGASTQGGQTDWFLPSVRESRILVENIYSVNNTLGMAPGGVKIDIVGIPYWSSTQTQLNYAYGYNFNLDGPNHTNVDKQSYIKVRAIRAF